MSGFFQLWWSDWASFLRMGRYGVHVWSSVAAVAMALIGEQAALRMRARRTPGAAQGGAPAMTPGEQP